MTTQKNKSQEVQPYLTYSMNDSFKSVGAPDLCVFPNCNSLVHAMVFALFAELGETFIKAMKRRGVHVKSFAVQWRPDTQLPEMEDVEKAISQVTRLRAVIETKHKKGKVGRKSVRSHI